MYKIYVIKEGDTLDSIAKEFDTTVEVLNRINGNFLNIEAGLEMIVPKNLNIPFHVYTVKKGDNLYEIARKYNANYKDLLSINGLSEGEYIYPNQEILIPKENIGIYTVSDVETLNGVASKLNVTPKELIDTNASIYLLPNQIILYKKEKRN